MPNLNVGLGAAMPAFAESFPSNGVMLENKTYANAATYDNVGAYSGYVNARAEYVNTLQQIIGGTYLPAGATLAEQCPKNSYCPGVTDATVNASESQGATSCPSGYPNSAVGASSNTQCYTACTLKSANIEHATAVSGNDYYGDGTDTCFATDCENGYHVNETAKLIEQRPLIDVDYTVASNDYGYINGDDSYGYSSSNEFYLYGLTENNNNTWAAEFNYGVVYGRASCQATLSMNTVMDYVVENMDAIMAGTKSLDQVRSDLTPIVGAAKANYVATYIAREIDGTASEEEFFKLQMVLTFSEDASFNTSDTGKHCYCQMTGFLSESPNEFGEYDISRVVAIESAPWVAGDSYGSERECASECAKYCGESMMDDNDISRKLMFGEYRVTDAFTCDANEIEIRWSDAAEEDIAANNAGMCTYGGDIRTPIRAATIPGKTFIGWKFLPQEQ
ncbi:MAG: hypothetical protein R8M70_02140 [Alphaproteobacteria bacterium]|nr:hypothetical protein [Alphaproteobacteria bacterium]